MPELRYRFPLRKDVEMCLINCGRETLSRSQNDIAFQFVSKEKIFLCQLLF